MALLRWILSCRCGRARPFHVRLPLARNPRRPASLTQAIAPAEGILEPPSPRSSVHVACVLSPPLCRWSAQHFLFCNHARAHSSIEHTSAVSTVTVRDPLRPAVVGVHERRRREALAITGSPLFVVFTRELPANLHAGLARDQSSRRSATLPLQEETTVCSLFTTSASDTFMFVITTLMIQCPQVLHLATMQIADT